MAKYNRSLFSLFAKLLAGASVALLLLALGLLGFFHGFYNNDLTHVVLGLAVLVVSVFFALRQKRPLSYLQVSGKEISAGAFLGGREVLGPVKRMEIFRGTSLIIYYTGGTLSLDFHNFGRWREMLKDLEQASGMKIEDQ